MIVRRREVARRLVGLNESFAIACIFHPMRASSCHQIHTVEEVGT